MSQARSLLHLREHQTQWVPALSDAQLAGLHATGTLEVAPAAGGGWHLGTTSWVGRIHLDGLDIAIHPKVTVERLLFLLGFAADPEGWRDEVVTLQADSDPLEVVAQAFVRAADRALRQGVLQGYMQEEASLPMLRGRLRAGDQLARRAGLALPLEVRYDEFTPDILENRVLVAATDHLMRAYPVASLRSRLRHLRMQLEGVSGLPGGGSVSEPRWTRLNRRYRPAVTLARLVLEATSYRETAGELRASSFLFDMNRVFEDFLGAALTPRLQCRGGRVQLQHPGRLDVDGRVPLRPDLTWWVDGRCRAIVDAKYKDLRDRLPGPGDLYQMLAYCTAYGLGRGHLVYASSRVATPSPLRIRNAGIEIVVHVFDLGRDPAGLLARADVLAAELSREEMPEW